MSATKKKPRTLKPHPIPLPADRWGGDRGAAERERRDSGYTSLRVSKRTRELLELLAKQARESNRSRTGGFYSGYSFHALGIDELLYWDALERLAKLPAKMIADQDAR